MGVRGAQTHAHKARKRTCQRIQALFFGGPQGLHPPTLIPLYTRVQVTTKAGLPMPVRHIMQGMGAHVHGSCEPQQEVQGGTTRSINTRTRAHIRCTAPDRRQRRTRMPAAPSRNPPSRYEPQQSWTARRRRTTPDRCGPPAAAAPTSALATAITVHTVHGVGGTRGGNPARAPWHRAPWHRQRSCFLGAWSRGLRPPPPSVHGAAHGSHTRRRRRRRLEMLTTTKPTAAAAGRGRRPRLLTGAAPS